MSAPQSLCVSPQIMSSYGTAPVDGSPSHPADLIKFLQGTEGADELCKNKAPASMQISLVKGSGEIERA